MKKLVGLILVIGIVVGGYLFREDIMAAINPSEEAIAPSEETITPKEETSTPKEELGDDTIYKEFDEDPRLEFETCESMNLLKEKQECAEAQLLSSIYDELKYPPIARENGVAGMCVIKFVVEKDGTASNYEIIRNLEAGCGDEALRVVKSLSENGKKWVPAKLNGKNVRAEQTLPVKFKLE